MSKEIHNTELYIYVNRDGCIQKDTKKIKTSKQSPFKPLPATADCKIQDVLCLIILPTVFLLGWE